LIVEYFLEKCVPIVHLDHWERNEFNV